jgi:predicted site-specific integrase-resolvase
MDTEKLLTEQQAADYAGYKRTTLRAWRSTGRGPVYYRTETGRIRYSAEDLDQFRSQKRRVIPGIEYL